MLWLAIPWRDPCRLARRERQRRGSRPRVFGMKGKVKLGPFNSPVCGTFHIGIAPKRPINLDRQDQ